LAGRKITTSRLTKIIQDWNDFQEALKPSAAPTNTTQGVEIKILQAK